MKIISVYSMMCQEDTPPGPCGCKLQKGDQVIVDGLPGKGMIVKREGRRLTVKFWSGEYVSRDQRMVHPVTSDYKSDYQTPMTRSE